MPYEHELIYSTVARARMRLALESPKQLLDIVFQNRKVIATVDLPCHLTAILQHYPAEQFTIQDLIYQHTLFPIYTPFVPEERRQQCLKWMANCSQGSVHLALGINASRIPAIYKLRYCPQCLTEQRRQHGEFYWQRLWQIQGACCLKHGKLLESTLDLRSLHRHNFMPPSKIFCKAKHQQSASHDDLFITSKLIELLSLPAFESPRYEQWTLFYHELAKRNNCTRGHNQINFNKILEKISLRWSKEFLKQYHLDDLICESSWLHHIFRKHRKSFSYLEHIIVITAFSSNNWSFAEVFTQVKSFKKAREQQQQNNSYNVYLETASIENRKKWLNLVHQHGIKDARQLNESLYAWLYRNDRTWLIQTNQAFHRKFLPQRSKVDWHKRDLFYVRQLIKINNALIWNLDDPRRSTKWWLKQTSIADTLEKNLHQLPFIQCFLERYSEDISTYQIRRLTKVFINMKINRQQLPLWDILRKAGLSAERMTIETKTFLLNLLSET